MDIALQFCAVWPLAIAIAFAKEDYRKDYPEDWASWFRDIFILCFISILFDVGALYSKLG